jgi:hypothetical protein
MKTLGQSKMTERVVHFAWLAAFSLACNSRACPCSAQVPQRPVSNASTTPALIEPVNPSQIQEISEVIYDGGLKNGWQDWGWAPHELPKDGPAMVRFDNWGGWILSKPGNNGSFGGLRFRMKVTPGQAEFLRISLWSDAVKLPPVNVTSTDQTDVGGGWVEVYMPLEKLNPEGLPFDRVVILAARITGPEFVPLDKIALTKATPRSTPSYDPTKVLPVTMTIDCRSKATKVSSYIYGFADNEFNDAKTQAAQWLLGGTARRWGGNPTSTYNWEIGAWNTGSDWFYENHEISHKSFLTENSSHRVASAVTVPMMGWVAKDSSSSSFPVSVFGQQEATDQWREGAGNGNDKKGKPLKPGPQSGAYQPITSAFVKRWVESIRQGDAKTGKRSVWMYILDNEPMLWNATHRDAHPEPLSYDELLERTIEYGTAIREADPDAVIAGPAEWGWMGYMYSAKDLALGGPSSRPDRRAHGDLPVVAYYLKSLAAREKKTRVHLLDVLDLHAYPYAEGIVSARADPSIATLRIRSTRMLWDESYIDESWVKEPVKLLPRMREWIDRYYPGRGISLGEWNFGGEMHMSGALATAEALGRFAQFGVASAFYWTYPPENSPAMWAFRAFRNYDKKGGHFLDWFTPATVGAHNQSTASMFASRDDAGKHLVVVLLNFSQTEVVSANIDLSSCGTPASVEAWTYDGRPGGYDRRSAAHTPEQNLVEPLSPYSITVLDVQLNKSTSVVH